MAIKATLRLEGGKALERKLKTLPTRVRNKVVRTALREGAKIVQHATKELAPVRTGLLKKSIKVRAAKRKRGRIAINVQMGAGDYKGETFYGAFIEYGHRLGKRTNGIKRAQKKKQAINDPRPFIEGQHFMETAFNNTSATAARTIEQSIKRGTEAEASKG